MALRLLLQLWWLTLAWASLETKPGCQPKCGNVTIPYPFGIGGAACSISSIYDISCNTSYNPPRPFIYTIFGYHEILEISQTQMRIKNEIASACFDKSGNVTSRHRTFISFSGTPFTFSDTANKFTAIGCNTLATTRGYQVSSNFSLYTGGCLSLCNKKENVISGSCSGIGCCQTSIPRRIKRFAAATNQFENNTRTLPYPCSYAFLVEQEKLKFKESDLLDPSFVKRSTDVPVVLDWVVGWGTCEKALRNLSTFACKENSNCYNSYNGGGYRCRCNKVYTGNPYLSDGCQDIDECADPKNNSCMGICINTPGGYNCSCPIGSNGDGKRYCFPSPRDKKKL